MQFLAIVMCSVTYILWCLCFSQKVEPKFRVAKLDRYIQASRSWLDVHVWYKSELASLESIYSSSPSLETMYKTYQAVCPIFDRIGVSDVLAIWR